jgi:hypothetical protein
MIGVLVDAMIQRVFIPGVVVYTTWLSEPSIEAILLAVKLGWVELI